MSDLMGEGTSPFRNSGVEKDLSGGKSAKYFLGFYAYKQICEVRTNHS